MNTHSPESFTIDKCPICNGTLQSSRVYYIYTTLEKVSLFNAGNGVTWFDTSQDDDCVTESDLTFAEEFFYCESDHNQDQMIEFINKNKENI